MGKKKTRKQADGKYHIDGKKWDLLEGTRAQVWHETAYKTSGGLRKSALLQNKHGRIVSRKKHVTEKKNKRLERAGYKPKKGEFVVMRKSMKKTPSGSKSSSSKKSSTKKNKKK